MATGDRNIRCSRKVVDQPASMCRWDAGVVLGTMTGTGQVTATSWNRQDPDTAAKSSRMPHGPRLIAFGERRHKELIGGGRM